MIDNDELRSETKTTNGEDGMTEQKAAESSGEVQPTEEEMGFQEIRAILRFVYSPLRSYH